MQQTGKMEAEMHTFQDYQDCNVANPMKGMDFIRRNPLAAEAELREVYKMKMDEKKLVNTPVYIRQIIFTLYQNF